MDKRLESSRFNGTWTPRTIDGKLDIAPLDPGTFDVFLNKVRLGTLKRDEKWQNLKSQDACLSLHGNQDRLFGIYLDHGAYKTVAAVRDQAHDLPGQVSDQGSDIFDRMLRPQGFKLKVLHVENMNAPVQESDRVAIRKDHGADVYEIGKLGSVFERFDQLYPDAGNGNLDSHPGIGTGVVRTVTLWEGPEAKDDRLFSMVAIPREAALEACDPAGDSTELARRLGLLPFELAALQKLLPPKPGHGDPLIIWGADDGGG